MNERRRQMNPSRLDARGFTLVELMVVVALLTLVIFMAGSFITFSLRMEKQSEYEYDFQAAMRQASRIINNEVRQASVTFTLTKEYFEREKKAKWNYLGLENGKEVVQYTWNPATNSHDRKILIASDAAISYNLSFSQVVPNSKLLRFSLQGINNGAANDRLTIASDLTAMNSLTVDDGGSPDNPAVAIAYRSDEAPKPEEVTTGGHVTMLIALVLDDSGSMRWGMDGKPVTPANPSRLSIMKNEAKKLIDKFASLGNIQVAIIPFAMDANRAGHFVPCTVSDKPVLKTQIEALVGSGGTNTGDGLRRAYHRIEEYNRTHSGDDIVNYIILLTDGNPTFYSSSTRKNHYTPKLDGSNVPNSNYVFGTGGEADENVNKSVGYVYKVGQDLVVGRSLDIRTFVIGFTAVPGGVTRAREMAEVACTSTVYESRKGTYYAAGSDIELESVFEEITTSILKETWHIYGPY